jgi:hypothetical protein
MQAEHLPTLQQLIEESGPNVVMNLEEVNLVDVEVVRFLAACEASGVALLDCSQYIRSWIAREQKAGR